MKKESETSADLSTFFHRAREAWGRRRCEKKKVKRPLTSQDFFTAQERHGAGGAVKKESETSAVFSTSFHRAGEAWGRRRGEKQE